MAAVCQSNSIFNMVPSPRPEHNCSFQVAEDPTRQYYVGPSSCLVFISGSFYDPCLLSSDPCSSKAQVTLSSIVAQEAATKIRFDVRSLGNGEVLGTWPAVFTGTDASQNTLSAAAAELLTEKRKSSTLGVPWRLSREFAERILQGGGTDARSRGSVGNTRQQWATTEGFASETTEFCDGIAGWTLCVCMCLIFTEVLPGEQIGGPKIGPSQWGTMPLCLAGRKKLATGSSTMYLP